MSRTFHRTLAIALIAGTTALAQQQTTPRPTPPGQRPAVEQTAPRLQTPQQTPAPGQQTPPPGQPRPQAQSPRPGPPEPPAQSVNIKIDLTITDQLGPGQPSTRTVTMIVADRQPGSIRSTANQVQARLFVDATPRILPNGNVQVFLGLEYNPRQELNAKPAQQIEIGAPATGGSTLNQRITLILEPGKPLIISQAADPVTDRKITVEVRAAILK